MDVGSIIVYSFVALVLLAIILAVIQTEYPPEILVAVKQVDNNTVIVWSEYPIIYKGKEETIIKMNGTYYTIQENLTHLQFKINGKTATPEKIQPAVKEVAGFTGITQLGTPDIVYQVHLKYG